MDTANCSPRSGRRASTEHRPRPQYSLAAATRTMAVATLISRITGFMRQLALAAVLGLGVVNDSYTVSNTLPAMLYEILLGGVLTSVIVPLLVRASKEDPDRGEAYVQRLVTVAFVALSAASVLAVVAAPFLAVLFLGTGEDANPQLATVFGYLLLPLILFYGLSGLFGAILNARSVFGPPAWAPVLNNVIVLISLGVYALVPGEISVNPARLSDPKLLVLGLGTVAGIIAQALVQVPGLRRAGFVFGWRWGWDSRLTQASGMAAWFVVYVLVGQLGFVVTTRSAAQGDPGGVVIYSLVWLLLQLPYGVLGYSLLTAIMPRMSAAAADADWRGVVEHLSVGSRYLIVLLVPITVVFTLAGEPIGIALFSLGKAGSNAERLGAALAVSAFGLLPYAVTMLQLRVFYSMADARTPTMINAIMVAVKLPLLLACPVFLDDADVVLGLTAANSLSLVVGAMVGQTWLRRRLGRVETKRSLITFRNCVIGAIPAVAAVLALRAATDWDGVSGAWLDLVSTTVIVGVVMGLALLVLRTPELTEALQTPAVARLIRHRSIRPREP
ncbi:MAG TPA: murein biosynthesis integral membrane protein MurJ [Pseudonocardiaceae bacterium]|nr:murein biosynthesis integral membrane protein MurJ [Pseudonocardiaceae bacterium]